MSEHAPTKPHRINCTCGAEPEAYKLRTGNKLLADTVRSWGYVSGRQESNGELVGRALHDMRAELATLRARVEALEADNTRLRHTMRDVIAERERFRVALEGVAYGTFNCSPRQYGMAMQEHARAALEPAP